MLEFHPNAARRFNELAQDLVDGVSRIIATVDSRTVNQAGNGGARCVGGTFRPDIYTKFHISQEDVIGDMSISKADRRGNPVAYCIQRGSRDYWIEGYVVTKANQLTESVCRVASVGNLLSQEMVRRTLFEWIKHRIEASNLLEFIEYLDGRAQEAVRQVELRAPIANLHLQDELTIGRLRLKPLTKDELDAWELHLLGGAAGRLDSVSQLITKHIRPMQGHSFASIALVAEPLRAQEILLQDTERAVSILRLFSVAAFHPDAISSCELSGLNHDEEANVWEIDNGMLAKASRSLIRPLRVRLSISSVQLKEWMEAGLLDFIAILSSSSPSAYEKRVLDSALLYSKCTIVRGIPEKLTYIYAALESAFLRNNTEPIQSNLAERMAFAIGNQVYNRRIVIHDVKSAYGLRSQFLHHGESVKDLQTVEKFMIHSWMALLWLAKQRKVFKTVDEMLEELENRKLS